VSTNDYIVFPIETEPVDLLQEIYDYLRGRIPGWQPANGSLDVWLAEAFAEIAADIRDLAQDVPPAIFRYFGATIAGVEPQDAVSATVDTTWTMKDDSGYTVPAGTEVAVRDASGNLQTFETLADFVVAPGSTTATPVTVVAVIPGADGSGLGSAGQALEIQSLLEYVTSVTMIAATSGGQDAETDDDYLNRLRTRMLLLTPTPILPQDFAVLARDIPGVMRSVAIDGLIPPSSHGNERAVAVAMTDEDGLAVSAGIKAAVVAYLDSLREVNFLVSAFDPTYTQIDVTVQVKARPGFTNVQADVVAALQQFLSPATWGIPDEGNPRDWNLTTAVRYLEVAEVINRVDGVDYITTTGGNFDLQTRIHSGSLGRTDIALSGEAPLTTAGTITVTVV
jgi:hypothetical protein